MADSMPTPLQMARMAIPRPQFFLVVLVGSIIVQALIGGIRYQPSSSFPFSTAASKPDGEVEFGQVLPKTALLVTAHPDDEAMFFGPTVLGLSTAGVQVYGLCMSTGNAEGKGLIRSGELYSSYSTLGVPASRVRYIDDHRLQDGMQTHWDPSVIREWIKQHMSELPTPMEAIISFDWRGISSHPNHISLFNATKTLTQSQKSKPLPLYILPTLEVWEKYNSAPFAVWEAITYGGYKIPPVTVQQYQPARELHLLSTPAQYYQTVKAMLQHKTQLVWYRYLSMIFSRYMFANRLVLYQDGMEELEEI